MITIIAALPAGQANVAAPTAGCRVQLRPKNVAPQQTGQTHTIFINIGPPIMFIYFGASF